MLWLFVVKAFSSHFRQILQFRGKLRLEFLGSFVEVRLGFRDPNHKGVHLLWTQHHVSETGEQEEFCAEAHHPVFYTSLPSTTVGFWFVCSSGLIADLKPRMPSPIPLPSSGSFWGPNTSRAIPRITSRC